VSNDRDQLARYVNAQSTIVRAQPDHRWGGVVVGDGGLAMLAATELPSGSLAYYRANRPSLCAAPG
jgi:hypothetical protein